MEIEKIFYVLGIEETTDEKVIRQAYMTQLKNTNPEDKPEEFKQLRAAYEEALVYIKTKNANEGNSAAGEKSQLDIWMAKVEECYNDMDLRGDTDKWREIFSDEICEGIDTSIDARNKLLIYMMDHSNLSHEVFKIIDETFYIKQDSESLKQQFPQNYIDYIEFYIDNPTFIDYSMFEYINPDGKRDCGDKYLKEYFDCKEEIDSGKTESALQNINALSVYNLYHPYEDVERMKVYVAMKDFEKAKPIAEYLENKCPDNEYVMQFVASAIWESGDKDKAHAIWKILLKKNPKNFMSGLGNIRYLISQNKYWEAKEDALEMLDDYSGNEELAACMKNINEKLCVEFKDIIDKGIPDERMPLYEMKLELGWCLLQNDRIEECIEYVKSLEEDSEYSYGYCNLYARALFYAEKYEEALPWLKKWLEKICGEVDDGTEKIKKRLARKPDAYHFIAICYFELNDYEQAEKYLNLAIENSKSMDSVTEFKQFMVSICLEKKDYDKAAAICDEIIEKNPNFFPAYVMRQEACYKLESFKQVIDDYHTAVMIYPDFYKPYYFAAKVYYDFGMYEDASKVLEEAKERNIKFSPNTKLLDVRIRRVLSNNNDERIALISEIERLRTDLDEKGCDIEDKTEIDYELALLYWYNDDFINACDKTKKIINENPDRMQYRMVQGDIYASMGRYEDAINEYQSAEKEYCNAPAYYYNLAACYEKLGKIEKAMEMYEKSLEYSATSTYRDVCEKIADYSWYKYQSTYKKELYDKAVNLSNVQLEEEDTPYNRINRGLMYMHMYNLEPAMADFRSVSETEPDDWAAWNNLGCCYKYKNDIKKAMECFEKSMECAKEREYLPYHNMANCHQILKNFDDAIYYYKKEIELFPERIWIWAEIGNIYEMTGRFDEAEEAYEKYPDDDDYVYSVLCVSHKKGKNLNKKNKIISFLKKKLGKNFEYTYEVTISIAKFCLYNLVQPELAVEYYKMAVDMVSGRHAVFGCLTQIAKCYFLMGQRGAAKETANNAFKYFYENMPYSINDYISFPQYRPARLGEIAIVYLCAGETEKAYQYFKDMDNCYKCCTCQHAECYESSMYLGYYYMEKGDKVKAYEYFKEALRRNSGDDEITMALKILD